jgi:alpha,alpha-trehalase
VVQAKKCRDNLKKFECKYGLANTQKKVSKEFKQWDYPNGWPNQEWIAIKGLLNYGFTEDAERLAKKWLNLNKKVFNKTGKFWEKYDVVTGTIGKEGRYPNQMGFGWTNAIFIKLISELGKVRT